jgi:hypothetical protein
MSKLAVVVTLVGCASNGSTGFEIDGSVQGTGAPAASKVVIVWDRVDTAYKWGDGTGSASAFTVTLAEAPPLAAQVGSAGLAVGYPVLIDGSETVSDGTTDLTFARLGIATDYAIIWKDALGSGADLPWETAFGGNYSCGHCVRQTTGHDTFELTPCANMTIVLGAATDAVCNWD